MQSVSINEVAAEFKAARPVFDSLGFRAPKSKAEIETTTGLRANTVHTALRKLLAAGLVIPGEPQRSGRRGRPALTFLRAVA